MRCILKTGQEFKIRGGIPISAARASVGGVWPRAKYGSAALYAGRSLVLSSWYRYCGTYNSPTDNTGLVFANKHLVHVMLSSRLPGEMKKTIPSASPPPCTRLVEQAEGRDS